MKGRWAKYLMAGAMVAILAACSSKPTDRGQQYKDGKLSQPFSLVNQPDAVGAPINAGDFSEQVYQIRNASPRLYSAQNNVYSAVQDWLRAGGDTRNASLLDSGYMWMVPVPVCVLMALFMPGKISMLLAVVIIQTLMNLRIVVALRVLKKGEWVRNLTLDHA